MNKASIARVIKHTGVLSYHEVPPAFLVPALQWGSFAPKTQFSTSAAIQFPRKKPSQRKRNPDNNPNRGVSALRRTGLKNPVSMSKEHLPQPVLDPKKRSKVQVDEDHPLWGFFNKGKTTLSTPGEDNAHGIARRRSLRRGHQLTRAVKVELGPSRNCDISLGKICIVSGGFVSRIGIDWQPRSMNVHG